MSAGWSPWEVVTVPAFGWAARRARALSHPGRLQVLLALRPGPRTVGEIALALAQPPARVSLHLSSLREAGWVRAERRGRCRVYGTDGDLVGQALSLLDPRSVAAVGPPRTAPAPSLRAARTCYDHLAGIEAVRLADEMGRRGWIVETAAGYGVSSRGERELLRRGVDVAACREARRILATRCLDWTERRPHVGGALGQAILRSLEHSGFVRRSTGRAVTLRHPVVDWLG